MTILDLQLGTPVNLLYGYRPNWKTRNPTISPFFIPSKPATRTFAATIPDNPDATWSLFPTATIHPDVESLLTGLYNFKVMNYRSDTGAYSVPAGVLMLEDADRDEMVKEFSNYLGIDLTKPYSFLLVQLKRVVGTATHEFVSQHGSQPQNSYLTDDANAAYKKLTPGSLRRVLAGKEDVFLPPAAEGAYLDTFYQYGTHFVSCIDAGDVVFQVYAYEADAFAKLKKAFDKDSAGSGQVSGMTTLAYHYYTTPVNTIGDQSFGFVAAYGKLLSLSNDPALASSIAAKAWQGDQFADPAQDTIFAPYGKTGGPITSLLAQFQQVVPIGLELLPVAELVENFAVGQPLNRIFKGALVQKYLDKVSVPFDSVSSLDWSSLYPETADSWLSTIATPTIDIFQERIDLSKIELVNTQAVKTFRLVSQILEVNNETPVALPGSQVTLISHVIDASNGQGVPVIELTDDGFENFQLACGEMYGALAITASANSKRYVLLDGFMFGMDSEAGENGRYKVNLHGNILQSPSADQVASIATNLQFSLVGAESIMFSRAQNSDQMRRVTQAYLDWLVSIIPADSQDADLLAMRVQAQYLARVAGNLKTSGVTVPYLTYDAYQGYVNSMIDTAKGLNGDILRYQGQIEAQKRAEQQFANDQQLNSNIKATGRLLTQYFGSVSQYQGDMSTYYGQIVAQKQQEFSKNVTDIQNLQNLMQTQQQVVQDSVDHFKEVFAAWETEQVVKFIFDVVTQLVSLGITFAMPANAIEEVKALGETAQKIQKVLNILEALSKMEKTIEEEVRTLQSVTRAMASLQGMQLDMPSTREWEEMSINIQTSLAAVSYMGADAAEVKTARDELVAAFQILTLRAESWLQAKAKQQQLLTDVYYNQRLQDINQAQGKRLSQLAASLNLSDPTPPDVSKIDLIGLTGQLQFQLKQVMAQLAHTLVLQDGAVQYEFFGQPTEMTQFALNDMYHVMMLQKGSIISALNQLNPPPLPLDDPITVYKEVPLVELQNGNLCAFIIQPSETAFFRYAMVRVNKVVANIVNQNDDKPGIQTTDSGQYLVDLTYHGNPFEDRNLQRQQVEFNTVERHFGPYLYDTGGTPQFGDQTGTIEQQITSITPFSTWYVSLPATQTNKGLKFNGTVVRVALTFHVTAVLKDPSSLAARPLPAALPATMAVPPSDTSLMDMLTQMYASQAVLKGWDVVLNMLEDQVNQFLKKQYDAKHPAGQDQTIEFSFCQNFGSFVGFTKFSATLAPPLLQFMENNHAYVTVTQAIKSGSVATTGAPLQGTFDNNYCKNHINDPMQWTTKPLDVSNNPTIQGSVPLTMVSGLVENAKGEPSSTTHSVVLDFASGSFVAKDLHIDTDNADFNTQLTNYFVNNPMKYVVNTVDFSDLTTLPALQPTSFKINTLTTNSSKNILQLFITTSGKPQSNLTINVNEPIPEGYGCSLMVATKILFNDIFVKDFNAGGTNIQVESVDPGKDFVAWSSKVTKGTVSGTVDWSANTNRGVQYRMNSDGTNTIRWDIDGLVFSRSQNTGLMLNYATQKTVNFQARQYVTGGRFGRWSPWEDHQAVANVSISGNYPVTVTGTGNNQLVQIVSDPPKVTIDKGDIKPTGACECNDNDLKIAVLNEMSKDVPAAIQQQMGGISFKSISILALENLLFPASQIIQMDLAYAPGDLVVLGHFTEQ